VMMRTNSRYLFVEMMLFAIDSIALKDC